MSLEITEQTKPNALPDKPNIDFELVSWLAGFGTCPESEKIQMGTILLIILILILLGALPTWPYSRGWGYGPSGIIGALLVILLIMFLLGYL